MLIEGTVTEPIKLNSLRELVSEALVSTASILNQGDGYTVHVMACKVERILTTDAGQVRIFASVDDALAELGPLGLETFTINISHRAKGDPAYDAWVREQVDETLRAVEESRSGWRSHADVWDHVTKATAAMVAERSEGYSALAKKMTEKKRR